jgi:hypothetical protein
MRRVVLAAALVIAMCLAAGAVGAQVNTHSALVTTHRSVTPATACTIMACRRPCIQAGCFAECTDLATCTCMTICN